MKTVLVVDDCEEIHQLLKGFFSQKKVRIISTFSGKEACQKLSNTSVDLIVCDLQMNNGDGLWLISELDKLHNDIPLLVFTTQTDLAPMRLHHRDNVFDKSMVRDLVRRIEKILLQK